MLVWYSQEEGQEPDWDNPFVAAPDTVMALALGITLSQWLYRLPGEVPHWFRPRPGFHTLLIPHE